MLLALVPALALLAGPAQLSAETAQSTPGQPHPTAAAESAAVRELFPAAERTADVILHLTGEEIRAARLRNEKVAARESLTVTVPWANGNPLGYLVVDDVKGKDMPITYMVAVDTALRVLDIRILAYRESHGGEVRNVAWRRQFIGRSPDEPLRHGREIRNITGATISARAITGGVRDVLTLLAVTRHRLDSEEPPR